MKVKSLGYPICAGFEKLDENFLADYSGPALIVSSDAQPILANQMGKVFGDILKKTQITGVLALVSEALNKHKILSNTCTFNIDGSDTALDVTAIPGKKETDRILLLVQDFRFDKNLSYSSVDSAKRYRDLVETSLDFLWEVDARGRFVFVSTKGAFGYKSFELLGRDVRELVVNSEEYNPLPFLTRAPIEETNILIKNKNRSTSCVVMSSIPIQKDGENGPEWMGCRGVCRNVTGARESEAALLRVRHREKLLNNIVAQIRDEIEPKNVLEAAASATAKTLGALGAQIYRIGSQQEYLKILEYGETIDHIDGILNQLRSVALEESPSQFELGQFNILVGLTHYRKKVNGALAVWKKSGADIWEDDHKVLISDIAHQLGLANEQVANHERITKLSRTDSLTGLLNRRAFFEEDIPRRVTRLARNKESAAVFFVDMDNLKKVNDVFGHLLGDKAILLVRDMLLKHSRPSDLVARFGGDEFVIWLDGITMETSEERVRELIQASSSLGEKLGLGTLELGISVGVACFDPRSTETVEELLVRADAAMYVAKKNGKGRYSLAKNFGT